MKMPTKVDWEAQEDADALVRAEEINRDKRRLGRAKTAAKVLANKKTKELNSLKKVIKRKGNRNSKSNSKRKK